MCPLGEFKIFDYDIYDKYGVKKAQDLLDNYCSNTYVVPNGDNYSCCSECLEGQMTEAQCTAQGGVLDSEKMTTGLTGKQCGKCQTCDGNLYINGCHFDDCTNPVSRGEKACERLSGPDVWERAISCCKPKPSCESGCPEGSIPVHTPADIYESGKYCIYKDTAWSYLDMHSQAYEIAKNSFEFVASKECKAQLTLSDFAAQKVISEVYTIIDHINASNVEIKALTLTNGGELRTKSASRGNFGNPATLELYGNHTYDFSKSWEHDEGSGAEYIPVRCAKDVELYCSSTACGFHTGYLVNNCYGNKCSYEIVQGSSSKRVSGTIKIQNNIYQCLQ